MGANESREFAQKNNKEGLFNKVDINKIQINNQQQQLLAENNSGSSVRSKSMPSANKRNNTSTKYCQLMPPTISQINTYSPQKTLYRTPPKRIQIIKKRCLTPILIQKTTTTTTASTSQLPSFPLYSRRVLVQNNSGSKIINTESGTCVQNIKIQPFLAQPATNLTVISQNHQIGMQPQLSSKQVLIQGNEQGLNLQYQKKSNSPSKENDCQQSQLENQNVTSSNNKNRLNQLQKIQQEVNEAINRINYYLDDRMPRKHRTESSGSLQDTTSIKKNSTSPQRQVNNQSIESSFKSPDSTSQQNKANTFTQLLKEKEDQLKSQQLRERQVGLSQQQQTIETKSTAAAAQITGSNEDLSKVRRYKLILKNTFDGNNCSATAATDAIQNESGKSLSRISEKSLNNNASGTIQNEVESLQTQQQQLPSTRRGQNDSIQHCSQTEKFTIAGVSNLEPSNNNTMCYNIIPISQQHRQNKHMDFHNLNISNNSSSLHQSFSPNDSSLQIPSFSQDQIQLHQQNQSNQNQQQKQDQTNEEQSQQQEYITQLQEQRKESQGQNSIEQQAQPKSLAMPDNYASQQQQILQQQQCSPAVQELKEMYLDKLNKYIPKQGSLNNISYSYSPSSFQVSSKDLVGSYTTGGQYNRVSNGAQLINQPKKTFELIRMSFGTAPLSSDYQSTTQNKLHQYQLHQDQQELQKQQSVSDATNMTTVTTNLNSKRNGIPRWQQVEHQVQSGCPEDDDQQFKDKQQFSSQKLQQQQHQQEKPKESNQNNSNQILSQREKDRIELQSHGAQSQRSEQQEKNLLQENKISVEVCNSINTSLQSPDKPSISYKIDDPHVSHTSIAVSPWSSYASKIKVPQFYNNKQLEEEDNGQIKNSSRNQSKNEQTTSLPHQPATTYAAYLQKQNQQQQEQQQLQGKQLQINQFDSIQNKGNFSLEREIREFYQKKSFPKSPRIYSISPGKSTPSPVRNNTEISPSIKQYNYKLNVQEQLSKGVTAAQGDRTQQQLPQQQYINEVYEGNLCSQQPLKINQTISPPKKGQDHVNVINQQNEERQFLNPIYNSPNKQIVEGELRGKGEAGDFNQFQTIYQSNQLEERKTSYRLNSQQEDKATLKKAYNNTNNNPIEDQFKQDTNTLNNKNSSDHIQSIQKSKGSIDSEPNFGSVRMTDRNNEPNSQQQQQLVLQHQQQQQQPLYQQQTTANTDNVSKLSNPEVAPFAVEIEIGESDKQQSQQQKHYLQQKKYFEQPTTTQQNLQQIKSGSNQANYSQSPERHTYFCQKSQQYTWHKPSSYYQQYLKKQQSIYNNGNYSFKKMDDMEYKQKQQMKICEEMLNDKKEGVYNKETPQFYKFVSNTEGLSNGNAVIITPNNNIGNDSFTQQSEQSNNYIYQSNKTLEDQTKSPKEIITPKTNYRQQLNFSDIDVHREEATDFSSNQIYQQQQQQQTQQQLIQLQMQQNPIGNNRKVGNYAYSLGKDHRTTSSQECEEQLSQNYQRLPQPQQQQQFTKQRLTPESPLRTASGYPIENQEEQYPEEEEIPQQAHYRQNTCEISREHYNYTNQRANTNSNNSDLDKAISKLREVLFCNDRDQTYVGEKMNKDPENNKRQRSFSKPSNNTIKKPVVNHSALLNSYSNANSQKKKGQSQGNITMYENKHTLGHKESTNNVSTKPQNTKKEYVYQDVLSHYSTKRLKKIYENQGYKLSLNN